MRLKMLASIVVIVLGTATACLAQDNESDYIDKDLDELLTVETVQVTLPGAHWHKEGQWMVGYHFHHMDMDGNRSGTSGRSTAQVLAQYPVAPLSMSMDMHMLMLMYGVSDDVTVMAKVPYLDRSMNHITRQGMRFTTHSSGLGDVELSGIMNLWEDGPHRLHGRLGVGLPTGSINVRDMTPMGVQRLPYPMQLGTGTLHLTPELTYTGQVEGLIWGAQGRAVVQVGTNANGYRVGDRLLVTAWVAPELVENFSPSFRIEAQTWGSIHGRDASLMPRLVPTADPGLRAGKRADFLVGVNFSPGLNDQGAGHRFSIEGGIPIYQDLEGPQLEVDWVISGGWQWTF